MQVSWPDTVDFYACQSEGRLPPCSKCFFPPRKHAAYRRVSKLAAVQTESLSARALPFLCVLQQDHIQRRWQTSIAQWDSAPGAAGPSCAMLVHARWQACRLLGYKRLDKITFKYDLACRRPQRSMQPLYGSRALALW